MGKGENVGHKHFVFFSQRLLTQAFTLPHNKFLDWSKLKALEDDKQKKVTEKLKFLLASVEKFMGKAEIACY